jgi:hypothetical protein
MRVSTLPTAYRMPARHVSSGTLATAEIVRRGVDPPGRSAMRSSIVKLGDCGWLRAEPLSGHDRVHGGASCHGGPRVNV